MASIKIAELKKINAACKNDFELDLAYYLMHNEKRLEKHIDIDDYTKIEAVLDFDNVYEGTGWRREKVGVKPVLKINRLTRRDTESACYLVTRIKEIDQGETTGRKSMKKLQDLSALFTTEIILDMVEKKEAQPDAEGAKNILEFIA